ncbi:MAG: hypothetical protein Q8N26_30315 [Myxococcales bacterium]|nr:hypothetical protein [Myxococcales bacterium]
MALAQAFFRNQPEGFFLTGGAVLAGWELEHRATDDLDLFTVNASDMGLGEQALRRVADELGASLGLGGGDLREQDLHARGTKRAARPGKLMLLERQEPPGVTALRAVRFENFPKLNSGATAASARMTS